MLFVGCYYMCIYVIMHGSNNVISARLCRATRLQMWDADDNNLVVMIMLIVKSFSSHYLLCHNEEW